MIRPWSWSNGVPVLAAVAVWLAAAPAAAHPPGGANPGGAHHGGVRPGASHVGGVHLSGSVGHPGVHHHGNIRHGGVHPHGSFHHGGVHHRSLPGASFYGYSAYPFYLRHFDAYPYPRLYNNGLYTVPRSYVDSARYYATYTPDTFTYSAPLTGYRLYYAREAATEALPAPDTRKPADAPVTIDMQVPADAEIWFADAKTKQTGTLRQFVSPPLAAGQEYTYEIRARWKENGREVTKTRRLTVRAGERLKVDFTAPEAEEVPPPQPKVTP
jgi:uncharacterized protein (TIGR03000 family)